MPVAAPRVAASLSDAEPPRENAVRVVWALAWPAVALNSLQVLNTLLDRFFIGHLEASALTAQSASQNVMFLMFSIAAALGTAATAIVSRSFGAKDAAGYRIAAREATGVTVIFGVVLGGLSMVLAPIASRLLVPPSDHRAFTLMTGYLLLYSVGLPGIFIIQTLAGSLRGIGDTKSPMVISGIQILMHICLNFLLIFPARHFGTLTVPGANMGLVGASTALSTSSLVAALIYLGFTARTPLGRLWKLTIPSLEWVERILRIAMPAAVMMTLRVFSGMAFTLILDGVPNASSAVAAMGVAFAVEGIMYMPSLGLQVAASALVGQSLGMDRPDRAERLSWIAAHHAAIVTAGLAVPLFWFAPQIMSFMVGGKIDIAGEASLLLRLLCATEIMFAYSMVLIGAMQGAGDTVRPLWISVFSMWGLRVPMALVLALHKGSAITSWLFLPYGIGMGAAGAWIAVSLTQCIQGILCIWVFGTGSWKTMKV